MQDVPKIWATGMWAWLTARIILLSAYVTTPNSVILGHAYERNYGDLPFKITQSRWNRHVSIGYL